MSRIKVGIVGGAGYTGGELIRLLLRHPEVVLTFVHSRSNAGKNISSIHTDLLGDTDLCFTSELEEEIDVLFLCVGHGEAKSFLGQNPVSGSVKVIDLSQDFRLSEGAHIDDRTFVYGLPELQRAAIAKASNIANPGCFATAIQLGLLPLAAEGLLNEVYTTGITGSTGAGQGLSATSHFSWRSNNIQAYKTLSHQHLGEIGQTIQGLQTPALSLHFVPWRGDFARGIFTSSVLDCDLDLAVVQSLFEDYYSSHPFTFLSSVEISLKQVVNTNKCVVQLERSGGKLVVHTAIDNLLKGASGQAVQNMNIMFGLPEVSGLQLKSTVF